MLIRKSRLFGGDGGAPFDESGAQIRRIGRIVVLYGEYVHSLEVTYVLENGERVCKSYGGPGGQRSPEILLADDERICGIGVRCGQYVDSLTFVTYRMFNLIGMKQYGPYGGPGGHSATVLSPRIREFFGRAGAVLDAIGFVGEQSMLVF